MTHGQSFADRAGLAQAVEVRSRGSFSTAAVTWQRGSGELIATIIAKATYALDPEVCVLLEEPDAIHEVDDHWDDDLRKSVRMPSDLAPLKNTYDIVVVGHAYAAKAAESTVLRVAVGSVDKCIEARVPSRFTPDGQLDAAAPALRMPLRYEVAPLGPDNPVGIDPTLYDEVSGSYRVPQLLPPDVPAKPGFSVPFTGVGPLAPSWRPRGSLLRAQDRAWLAAMLDRPIPTGFDAGYFSIAPTDQRAAERFRHDERILLECLHPQHPRLVTNLAGVRPVLSSNLGGKLPSFTGDTLLIDSDRGVVTLTFRALVEIDPSRQTRFEVHADSGVRPRRTSVRPGARFDESTMKLDGKTLDAVKGDPDTEDHALDAGSPLPFPASARTTRQPSQAFDGLPFRTGGDAAGPEIARPRSQPAPVSQPGDRSLESVLRRTETLTDTADPLQIPPPLAPPPPLATPRTPALPAMAPLPRAPLSRPPLSPSAVPAAVLAPRPAPPPPPSVPGSAVPPPPVVSAQAVAPSSARPAAVPMGGLGSAIAAPQPLSALAPLGSPSPPAPSAPALVPSAQTVGEQRAQLHTALPAVVHDERRVRATNKESGRDDPFGAAFTSPSGKSGPHASAKLASDEAAGRPELKPAERREPARDTAARRCLVDLLGCDPEVPRRLRRSRAFSSLLSEFLPPRALRRLDEVDADREKDRDDRQRLDVLRVLSCGEPLDASGLAHSLDSALDDTSDLEIPVLLTAGELRPSFDELEALKLAVKIAQPLSPTDKRLLSAVALANEVIGTSPSAETSLSLMKQLEAAVNGLNFPSRYLSDNVERSLLDTRAYKKRVVLGESRIRCDLVIGGGSGLPCYVPEAVGSKLPLLQSFPVVAIVEVRPREDAFESHHEALVVLALGRVLRRVKR